MRSTALTLVWLAFLLAGQIVVAGERYAFLVGVGTYDEKELKSLPYARADILEFRDVLLESGMRPENIILMVDDLDSIAKTTPIGRFLPESKKIREELGVLLPALEEDDSLVIGMAGHGVQYKGDPEPYFCPSDVKLEDKESLVSLSWLYRQLEYDSVAGTGCKARQKLLIVDACRNDPRSQLRRSSGGPELESLTRPQLTALPQGIIALFSCAEGQQALEHDPLKHGIFFFHVLEAWRGKADSDGDRQLTLDEMVAFTKIKTQTYARVELRAPQTPRQRGYFDGTWVLRSLEHAKRIRSSIGLELALIPAGTFQMGSTEEDIEMALPLDRSIKKEMAMDERPQHEVRMTRPFYLGVREVTRGEFTEFVRQEGYRTQAERDGKGGFGIDGDGRFAQKSEYNWRNPGFEQQDDHPVVNVSWHDAKAFCEWLSKAERSQYRLPTEAEWEYACRGETTTIFQVGNSADELHLAANVADQSVRKVIPNVAAIAADDGYTFTAPVGQFRANRFGLHDMHGNVWEWCQDVYDAKAYEARVGQLVSDPVVESGGANRVSRGGAWRHSAWGSRSSFRDWNVPSNRFHDLGFRVARDVAP